jgi:hypothetical protein
MIGIAAISLLALALPLLGATLVKADSVNFQVTVVKSDFSGWADARVEVWDGTNLIASGNTNSEGDVFFSLPVGGPYEFRAGDASTTASVSAVPDAVLVGVILMPTVVITNHPPVADAGPDQTVELTSHAGAQVTLDGSGSSDPDGDPLTYQWTWSGGSANDVKPTATFPLGKTTVTLTVSDGQVSDTDTVDINVVDTTAPVVEITYPIDGKYYKSADMLGAGAYKVTEANAYTVEELGYDTSVEGLHTYEVIATDVADNIGSDSIDYTVDNTAPDILINYPVDKAIYKLGTMLGEPDYAVDDDFDDNPVVTVGGYDTGLGTHTMTVTATDTAGNTSTDNVIYQVQKNPKSNSDKTGPFIIIKSPKNKTYYTYETLRIFFGVQDKDSGVASYQATLDGNPVNNRQKIDLSKMTIGSHTFTVTAADKMGNTSTKSVTFNVASGVLKAKIHIVPDTINLKSQSDKNAVTAIINLPFGFSARQIDVSTVKLNINGTLISAMAPNKKSFAFIVKFDRQQVINALQGLNGKVTVTVTGALKDGTQFTGTDIITVINRGNKR